MVNLLSKPKLQSYPAYKWLDRGLIMPGDLWQMESLYLFVILINFWYENHHYKVFIEN